jgi:tRNA(fMet)-specific endonuclease VapC
VALLVDSSILISMERRRLEVAVLLETYPDEPVALSSVTASELLFGLHRSDTIERRLRRESFVESVLGLVPVLPFDLMAARHYAQISADLRSAGQIVDVHDLMIAATALVHDYQVLTDNLRDFARVPGVTVRQPEW